MNGLEVYHINPDLLTVGEILEDGNLCNVVKAADLNDTLKSVRDEIDGYKSALGDLRAETEDKAMLFAEWTHMVKGLVWSAYRKAWIYTTATTVREYTTAELFASPKFLAYYEERKSK